VLLRRADVSCHAVQGEPLVVTTVCHERMVPRGWFDGEGRKMGFLRRLLGGPATRGMTLNITDFRRVRDDAALEVVGEAYRQENVALARPPGPDDLPPGMPPPPPGYFKATLIPEPTNQYDRNAIAVYLWSSRAWAHAGYLARSDALAYQPLFRHLATESTTGSPAAIACDAALAQERGGTGVILHLGSPGECAVELATEGPPIEHRWAGKTVVFTGQGATTIHGVPVDRHAQVMLARWAGCELLPRLTKRTDALILADPNELTANLQRAREYGVEVVQEPDFFEAVGITPEAIGRLTGRWARA